MASLHLTHLHQRWLLFFLFFPSTLASFTEHVRRFCYFFPSSSCQSYSRLTCRPVTITLLQQHHRHDISPKSITITIITPCSSSSPSMIQAKTLRLHSNAFSPGLKSPTSIVIASVSVPSFYSLPPLSSPSSSSSTTNKNASGHGRRKSKDRRYWGFPES
jgi:hypothetical protein